jgi:hypothetical protein
MYGPGTARFRVAVAATFAITACGGSAKKVVDGGDAGASYSDSGQRRDLPAEVNPSEKDTADAALVVPDVGTDTPVSGHDSASLDQRIALGDAGPAGDVVQKEAAAASEAGPDGNIARNDVGTTYDTGTMDVALDAAVDARNDGARDRSATDADQGASLTIDPTIGDFGVTMGQPSDPIVFTVRNVGLAVSGSPQVTTSGCRYFDITSNSCVEPVPAGQSCQLAVVFDAPGGEGSCYGSLIIAADGFPGGQVTIPLSGEVP